MKIVIALALTTLCLATPAFADDTLFADLGGQAGIDRFVDKSVDKYLTDDRIKDTFAETNADFNAVVEDLQSAMEDCGIGFATQNRFLARLAPYQHQVVTR
jgi:hemoglobin